MFGPNLQRWRDRVYKRRGLESVVNMVVFGVVDTTLNYVIQKFFFGSSVNSVVTLSLTAEEQGRTQVCAL